MQVYSGSPPSIGTSYSGGPMQDPRKLRNIFSGPIGRSYGPGSAFKGMIENRADMERRSGIGSASQSFVPKQYTSPQLDFAQEHRGTGSASQSFIPKQYGPSPAGMLESRADMERRSGIGSASQSFVPRQYPSPQLDFAQERRGIGSASQSFVPRQYGPSPASMLESRADIERHSGIGSASQSFVPEQISTSPTSIWDDTDDFGNPLTSDAQGRFNFEELRDRAVNKFNQKEYDKPFRGEVSRTGTSQPRMVQTENGVRPMTENEMMAANKKGAGQKFLSIFGQDDASIEGAKANQAPVTDKFKLSESDMDSIYPNVGIPGFKPTQYPSLMTGTDTDPQGTLLGDSVIDNNANVYKGPITDRWAAKPGEFRIGKSYSMGEGDWRDPVGGTEYNYTDTDFAGNPLDTDFEGNVPSEADRDIIREMRKGTGTGNIYPGDADTLFDRKTVESTVTGSTVTGTSGENMDEGTGSDSTEGKGEGKGKGKDNNKIPPAAVIQDIATGDVVGKDADNLWGKIQSKGFWSTPIEGGAGKWDNRLFRLGEMMEHMGTPLSKRGDSPTKRWTTTAKDSAVATGKVKAAKAKMEKDKMTRLYNRANLDTSNVAASILHYLPQKGWFAKMYSGMSEAERKSYSKAIVLKAEVIMNTLLDANPPVEVSMEQALIKAESMITVPDQQGLGKMTVKPKEK